MKRTALILGAPLALLFASGEARADLSACGNIQVSAEARCKVETKGGCTAYCEPLRFEAACSARLYAQCDGRCNAQASVDCEGTCRAECTGQCNVDPGSLDCNASCQGRCDTGCTAQCAASGNKGECSASCKASCSGKCDAQCTGTPPSASCDAKCESSCRGSCTARANMDCQVNCQSGGYAQCKSELTGGCQAQCEKPEGALFCDGSYVDTGDRLRDCIDALNAYLNVKVDASGSASCEGNECQAQGKASVSCAAANAGSPIFGVPSLVAGTFVLVVAAARRRRRRD